MTMPDERFRATSRTREFLLDLCKPSATPKVPLHVRDRARSLLKHFPTDLDLEVASAAAPDVFATQRRHIPLFPTVAKPKRNKWTDNFLFGKKNQK
jgi:hypothetical protein